jgi:hypothetical protein
MSEGGTTGVAGAAVDKRDTMWKSCPKCALDIRTTAKRCHHCLSDLEDDQGSSRKWLTSNLTYIVPIVTFLYVAFQVFKAGDFEVNTVVDLIRESGITTIFIGVILVQLPMELLISTLVGSAWLVYQGKARVLRKTSLRAGSEAQSRRPVTYAALIGLPPVALAIVISPWPFVVGSVIALGLALLVVGRRDRTAPMTAPQKGFVITVLAVAALLGAYLLSLPTIWMAAETLQTTSHGTIVGYVVSSDGKWTTVLTPSWTHQLPHGRNSLIRLDTTDVTKRTLCSIDFQDAKSFGMTLHLRAFAIPSFLLGQRPATALTPKCPSS